MKVTHSLSATSKTASIVCKYERLQDGRILFTSDQEERGKMVKRTSIFLTEEQLHVLVKGGHMFIQSESKFKLPNPIDLQL